MTKPLRLLFLFFLLSLVANAKFKAPPLTGPIIDEARIITPQHQAEIDTLIRNLNQQGTAQIQVYVTTSLQGLTVDQASIDVVDQWKLGTKNKDNGILFLVAPNERKIRIEVGQGLEGSLPDVYAKRINEDIVVPYFKNKEFSEGIYRGVLAMASVLGGDTGSISKSPTKDSNSKDSTPIWFIVLIFIMLLIGRKGGRRRFGGGSWIGAGGFGGSSGGGGWSGGGGGFSGGGSSSSW